jgi:hypothetical protein
MSDYIAQFGRKQCCFSDVRPLLPWFLPDDVPATASAESYGSCKRLSPAARNVFAVALAGLLKSSSSSCYGRTACVCARPELSGKKSRLDALRVHASAHQVSRFVDMQIEVHSLAISEVCASDASTTDKLSWLLTEYLRSLGKPAAAGEAEKESDATAEHGEENLQRESRVGDNLLLLATHMLVDKFWLLNPSGNVGAVPGNEGVCFLYQAAALLEKGLADSEFNYQFRLQLIRIYGVLGAFEVHVLLI